MNDQAAQPPAPARVEILCPGAVALSGRLDARTVGLVRADLHRLVDEGSGELNLDVARATVVDSWGLGLLVGVHRRARLAGRTLVLIDVPTRLDLLIRHTRLHRVLVCRSSTNHLGAASA